MTSCDGAPVIAEYVVKVDVNWHARRVEVRINGGGGKDTLILLADGYGGWWREKRPLELLKGCLDVDLSWSPSSYTPPIRRMLLQPGQSCAVDVAKVAFPDLILERSKRTYERLDARRYRLTEGARHGEMIIDDDGLVIDHAEWMAAASA